jgi:exopolysaccharide production protein ExoZ
MPVSRIVSIQYLRGLAAVMVVCYHAIVSESAYSGIIGPHVSGLAAGVDIFFVISGFIMMSTTSRQTPFEFALKRVIRIVPLYWLVTFGVIALALSPWHFFKSIVVTPATVTQSLAFIAYQGTGGGIAPIVYPGWTLNVEMFFYCVFALALFLPSPKQRLVTVGSLFLGLTVAGYFIGTEHPEAWLLTRPRLLEFAAGMGIAYLMRSVDQFWVLLLIPAGLACFLGAEPLWIIGATLIVFAATALDQAGKVPTVRSGLWLGDVSYSLYLIHLIILSGAKAVWEHQHWVHPNALSLSAFIVAAVALCLIVAGLTFRYVEQPMLRAMQSWTRRKFVTRIQAPAIEAAAP